MDEFASAGEMCVSTVGPLQIKGAASAKGRTIGTWRDVGGDASETDAFTIHYSKRGTHVVPSRPSWGQR